MLVRTAARTSSLLTLDVDVIVIGAGVAGLSLAAALAHPGRRLRVALLEPRRVTPNPRRWIFAAEAGHALEVFVDARFDRLRYDGVERAMRRQRIDHVRADAVQARALDRIAAHDRAQLDEEVRIAAISGVPGALSLETSHGRISARAIVDTRPDPSVGAPSGWTQIIAAARVDTLPGPVGLSMSKPQIHQGGVVLDQQLILPFGEALVERACFAPPGTDAPELEAGLAEHLERQGVDLASFRLHRLVLPLSQMSPARGESAAHVVQAGAGALRFSTGAAALRLAEWADRAAQRFVKTGRMPSLSHNSLSARAVRRVMARRLGQGQGAAWFSAVFERLPVDVSLRLVSGTGSAFDFARAALIRRAS